jgi:hypothetical protein
MQKHQQNQQRQPLKESLRAGDLEDFVESLFSVDRYSSKMGEDRDVVVLGFRVKEKLPAMDLVEFIETGYNYVLDADMSSGEEHDGQYQVFVELERTEQLPEQMNSILRGVSQLTGNKDWRFRYQKSPKSVEFDIQNVSEHIPTSPMEYENKILEIKTGDLREFFDQGSADISLDTNNNITFSRPYSGDVTAKFVSIGDYEDVKDTVPGSLSLDESSQGQVLFLNKFLGNYEINKIGNRFLIRNGSKAVVIEKGRW